jgi:hypothetical protein
MRGSASKTKAPRSPRLRLGQRGCPMLSHLSAAGGTAKVCADWAFVSCVSPVSPNLKIIDRIQKRMSGNGRRGITGGQAPCAETGRTGGTGAKVTRFFDETPGARHTWDRWDHPTLGEGATVQGRKDAMLRPCNPTTWFHAHRTHDKATCGAQAPN